MGHSVSTRHAAAGSMPPAGRTLAVSMVVLSSLVLAAAAALAVGAVPRAGGSCGGQQASEGKVMYNGICSPNDFPPYQNYSRQTPHPTYLDDPPAPINITVGRQLFVDSFLVGNTSGVVTNFHTATYYPKNPILSPDQPWEGTFALPYSGGVFWEDAEQRLALWYRCGTTYADQESVELVPDVTSTGVCLAYSTDGIHFEKPVFTDVDGPDCQQCNGTNMVRKVNFDGNTIWLDKKTTDPSERYKMASVDAREHFTAYTLLSSPDGRHWTTRVNRTGDIDDNSRIFYNPFRGSCPSRHSATPRSETLRVNVCVAVCGQPVK